MSKFKKLILFLVLLFIILYYIWLSVNPVDYSFTKASVYKYIPEEFKLEYKIINKNMTDCNLNYPVIFKPINCNGVNRNVKIIKNLQEHIDYLEGIDDDIIVQEYYNSNYEISILYERNPLEKNGKIISITEKEVPSSWKPLRCSYNNNDSGVNCSNRYDLITGKLEDVIDKISKNIPGFYAGRYDIRYDSEDDLKNGKNFKILELNGVMGYDLNVNVSSSKDTLYSYYLGLKWVARRLMIGFQNILILNGANVMDVLKNTKNRIDDCKKCNDWEHLVSNSSF